MRIFSIIISGLFHPLLIPTIIFSMILYYSPISFFPENRPPIKLLGIIFFTTFLVPALSILFLIKQKIISNIYIEDRKERVIPYFFTGFLYLSFTFLIYFQSRGLDDITLMVILGSMTACVFAVAFINLFWKISAHGTSAGGFFGMLLKLCMYFNGELFLGPLIICILLCGLLLMCRLYLGAHSPSQIFAGFLLGTVVSFISTSFLFQ